MATFQLFHEAREDLMNGVHDLTNNTIKVAFLTSAASIAITDATPAYADYSANETTGGNVPAGGATLAGKTVSSVTSTTLFNANDVVINQNASNPSNVRYSLYYNDSAAGKNALGFVDWSSDQDLSAGNNTIDHSNGIFDITGN